MPQPSAYTPQALWNTAMKLMIVRFQTMLTTAGMVNRSSE